MNSITRQVSHQRRTQGKHRPQSHAATATFALPDMLCQQSLAVVALSAAGSKEMRIELPRDGAVRMRTLVHRGTQRPVFKVPSVKLDRVVQCESILEADTALLLDVHPSVVSFAEQPARLHYPLGGLWRSHIPDFAVQSGGRITFVEVKFEKDVSDEVKERTDRMKATLGRLAADYRLLTEAHIRDGHALQNAVRLQRRARHAVSEVQLLQTHEALRAAGGTTLATFGWSEQGSLEAVCIAKLVIQGKASVDTNRPLTNHSRVWLSSAEDLVEAASW